MRRTNTRTRSGSNNSLLCFLDDAVRARPERVALEIPPGRDRPRCVALTYADLARQSDLLAQALRPFVHGECVVGILLPRTCAQLFIAQLAVLNAGATYTCLDLGLPDERMRVILQDAGAVALLTDGVGQQRTRLGPAGLVADRCIRASRRWRCNRPPAQA